MRQRMCRMIAGGIALALLLILPVTGNTEDPTAKIHEAYKLRMTGKADAARGILEQVLIADTTNAAAWYELARVHHQTGLANPLKMLREIDVLQLLATKATRHDPDNVAYAYYKAYVTFLRTYGSIMREQRDADVMVAEVITAYVKVLEMDPTFDEARLYMAEVLNVPKKIGGSLDEAIDQVHLLEERNPILAAKGRDLLLGEDADRVVYWQKVLEEHPGDAEVLEQLGKAYLNQGKTEEGIAQLEAAMKADPDRTLLLLDVAKYFIMVYQKDASRAEEVLPKAKAAIDRYLSTEPIRPLKAYALHAASRIERNLGAEEAAERLLAEAKELDPHVSKAFAPPPSILFTKPGEVSHHHRYFSRPY